MRIAKLAALASVMCISTAGLMFAQDELQAAKLDAEKRAMLDHYQKVLDETRNEIKEVRRVMGEPGEEVGGNRPGMDKLGELSRQIALQKGDLAESKRQISRGESKQKVIRMKLVRIEKELSRALKEMPNDPVAQALKKLVEIDESAFTLMKKKFESGQIPTSELSTVERKLAESRLELAKHQWEESAEARKALAAARTALEDAVFETEMLTTESEALEKEIDSLRNEQVRLEGFVEEETALSMRAADLQNLITLIRGGNPDDVIKEVVESLKQKGVKVYEPTNKTDKPAEPSKEPGK